MSFFGLIGVAAISGIILGLVCPNKKGFGLLKIRTGGECIRTRWKCIAEKNGTGYERIGTGYERIRTGYERIMLLSAYDPMLIAA